VSRNTAHVPAATDPGVRAQARLRLDKWLWQARFFKTRSLAAKFVEQSRVRLDGRATDKPSAVVSEGTVLTFPLGDRVRIIQILKLGERRGPAAEARTLYADLANPQAQSDTRSNPSGVILAPAQRSG